MATTTKRDPNVPVISLRGIQKTYPQPRTGLFGAKSSGTAAVDGVDLDLFPGESLGLVGESGCGKTTLGRIMVGQIKPDRGELLIAGRPVSGGRSLQEKRQIQMVFQDPMSSLNPQLQVGKVLEELLRTHHLASSAQVPYRTSELLASVGLPERFRHVRPATLSGGQRQRVSIARALALQPEVLVADEITSALDVSIQAQVLALLQDLKVRLGLTILFISHNMAVVRQTCSRVAVMYLGRIVEIGPTEQVFDDPQHPYTRLLLASIPRLLETIPASDPIAAEPSAAVRGGTGCRFAPRCPKVQEICTRVDPPLSHNDSGRASACHFSAGSTAAKSTVEEIQ